jgi:DNA polymerase IV
MLNIPTGLQWLYLDLNSYFASVEQQLDKRLRGRPIAVVPTDTDATCAIAASYEAKAYGIKTGTMIYKARQMCPELITVPARHDKYVDYHHKVMNEINRYLPLTKICSIDEVACRLMGPECEEKNALALAQKIKKLYRHWAQSVSCQSCQQFKQTGWSHRTLCHRTARSACPYKTPGFAGHWPWYE